MINGITAGITADGKHSYDDFGLYISDRKIGMPKKHSKRETIPYMNGSYDFTKLNGDVSWGDRELLYKFDIAEATTEERDRQLDQIINWLFNIHDKIIQDDTMPDYHFLGSYEEPNTTEDGEKTELEVKFVCYPFKIYNTPSTYIIDDIVSHTIEYDGQAVKLTAHSTANGTLIVNGYEVSLTENTTVNLGIYLERGTNTVSKTGSGTVTLSWTKEVL